MNIGNIELKNDILLAPMAGITDLPFRLICKEMGADVVYTEFVSSNGIIRENKKTFDLIHFIDEERPIGIQIFGEDPEVVGKSAKMIFQRFKPDIIDINFGCPVPKVTKKGAGSAALKDLTLMEEITSSVIHNVPEIPVTVKMRSGWSDEEINAVQVAQMVEDAGAAAVAVHGRTAKQAYKGTSNWDLIGQVASAVRIPVWGSGDCVEPDQLVDRMAQSGAAGVLVGRGALRNPWVFAQALDLANGKPARHIPLHIRGQFLLDYLDLLMTNPSDDDRGVHRLVQPVPRNPSSRERWVVNKLRALASWYTKGLNRGTALRQAINSATSPEEIRDFISRFFLNAECSASSFSTSVGVSD